MTDLGMDPAAVRDLAGRLDAQATALDTICGRIEAVVRNMQSAWSGPDMQAFVGCWNEQHKPALTRARDSVAGLATAAGSNADEQDRISGVAGGGSDSLGSGRKWNTSVPAQPGQVPGAPPGVNVLGISPFPMEL